MKPDLSYIKIDATYSYADYRLVYDFVNNCGIKT